MTTYYVDFVGGADANNGTSTATAWKRVKGMVGVAGTAAAATLSGGDTIVFKKGVTWTSSFPWNAVGGSSSMVTYTTEVGFGTGAQPTFDYQGIAADGAGNGILNGASWTTFNDLNFVNAGVAETSNGIRALYFHACHDSTITNCTFATESELAIYYLFDSVTSFSNFTWTGNDFSHMASAIWFASSNPGTSMHHIRYNNNTFHDVSSQIGGGVHGDGAFHGFSSVISTDEYLDDMQFCNNRFYGDWTVSHDPTGETNTGQFYMEMNSEIIVANNVFEYEGLNGSNLFGPGILTFSGRLGTHGNNIQIYGNSFGGNSEAVTGIFADNLGPGTNVLIIKNNSVYIPHFTLGTDPSSRAALTSDYNFWESTGARFYFSDGDQFKTYAQWQALGYDAHSIMGGDPLYTNYPTDLTLQSGSSLRGAGTDLSGLGITIVNSDHNGLARGSSWDIGAYQYSSTPPSQPSGSGLGTATMA